MGSGFTTFTAGNVLTASEVNNYLMEQSIMVFATTGARDSAITAPEAGMTAYINSGDSSEGLYSYTGTTWNKGPSWNAPWGLLGKASLATQSATSASHNVLQDGSAVCTLTATTITNRNYRVTSTHHVWANGGAATVYYGLVIGGTLVSGFQTWMSSTIIINTITNQHIYTETAGASRIFKVQLNSSVASQVTDYGAAAGLFNRTLVVEDIGPSGAPN